MNLLITLGRTDICIKQCSPETQNPLDIEIQIQTYRFPIGIGSHDMEADECYDLPSASWRITRASDIIPAASEDLRSRSSDVCRCLQAEGGCPSSGKGSKLALPPPFCSIQILMHWMVPTHTDEDHLHSIN